MLTTSFLYLFYYYFFNFTLQKCAINIWQDFFRSESFQELLCAIFFSPMDLTHICYIQQQIRRDVLLRFFAEDSHQSAEEYINANDVITFCLDLMNKMRRNLINLRWNLIKYIQFDGFIIQMWRWWWWRENNRNVAVVVVVVEGKQQKCGGGGGGGGKTIEMRRRKREKWE